MLFRKSALFLAMVACAGAHASPTLSIATSTTSRNFTLEGDSPLVVTLSKNSYQLTVSGLEGDCAAPETQKVKFNKPLALNCNAETELPVKIRFSGDYAFIYDPASQSLTIKRQPKKVAQKTITRPIPKVDCAPFPQGEVTIAVGETFKEGEQVKEAFTGQTATVRNGQVTMTPSKKNGGVLLLESVQPQIKDQPLNWRNANIYFVMVDRFHNGDPDNDLSYGRRKDGKQEIGTFHGGDLKGVIDKLDYIQSLGTDVIWLSPIVEQVHGFVGGGDSGSFPFYAYHGYWARDFTKIDENFGKDDDLKTLVDEAHKRGIKIMLDAVVNHPGYATLNDITFDQLEVLKDPSVSKETLMQWQPGSGQNWHSVHDMVDYGNSNWKHWWGGDWVRTGLPGYDKPGSGAKLLSLAGLPDFKTESDKAVTPPQWLLNNPGTRVTAKEGYTVSDYLVEWQTDWVKRFGIDAFRVDTVKHVEGEVWLDLKQKAADKLAQWQKENNQSGQPFWMMGEVWGHSAYRSPYADEGFDALINFDLQGQLDKGATCLTTMSDSYANYSQELQEHPDYSPVSYMSSHDTELFFARFQSFDMQRQAANALMLSPGTIQVYYGDEVARGMGPYADDFHQGTRSDMVWKLDAQREALLEHWQTLGQFRQRNPAIGAGLHTPIPQQHGYGFSRTLENNKVMVYYAGK